MVPILEDYQDYTPPSWFQRTVKRLLSSLSEGHVQGLSAIVLTNSSRAMGRKGGRSSRRNRRGTPIGRYHRACRGERAWIELIVDSIVEDLPRPLTHVALARDIAVGRVLYHEIGHHLHETVGSAARGGESSAEAWRKRLSRVHGRKRYGYLRPVLRMIRSVVRTVKWVGPSRRRAG